MSAFRILLLINIPQERFFWGKILNLDLIMFCYFAFKVSSLLGVTTKETQETGLSFWRMYGQRIQMSHLPTKQHGWHKRKVCRVTTFSQHVFSLMQFPNKQKTDIDKLTAINPGCLAWNILSVICISCEPSVMKCIFACQLKYVSVSIYSLEYFDLMTYFFMMYLLTPQDNQI